MVETNYQISNTVLDYLCFILSILRRLDYSAAIQEFFRFLGIGTKHIIPGSFCRKLSNLVDQTRSVTILNDSMLLQAYQTCHFVKFTFVI